MEPTELSFGRILIGTWFCNSDKCNASFTPKQMREKTVTINEAKVLCPKCENSYMTYDEAT